MSDPKLFQPMKQNYKEAGVNLRQRLGIETDPLLRAYQNMTPEHFKDLGARHGVDNLTEFIRHMEMQLAQKGVGGKS